VRHRGDIHHYGLTVRILTERHTQDRLAISQRLTLKTITEAHDRAMFVWHLNSNGATLWNRRDYSNTACPKAHREIVLQRGDPSYLHTGSGFKLE
jgi:indole-3-glycerol phosphate synthase